MNKFYFYLWFLVILISLRWSGRFSPCRWWPFPRTTWTEFGCTDRRSASGRPLQVTWQEIKHVGAQGAESCRTTRGRSDTDKSQIDHTLTAWIQSGFNLTSDRFHTCPDTQRIFSMTSEASECFYMLGWLNKLTLTVLHVSRRNIWRTSDQVWQLLIIWSDDFTEAQ